MAGTSSAKTRFALLPGHDEKENHFQLVRKSLPDLSFSAAIGRLQPGCVTRERAGIP
jgi:hypothetical protein